MVLHFIQIPSNIVVINLSIRVVQKSLSKTHPTAATEEDHTIHTTKPQLFTNPTLKTQELYIT